MAGPQLNWIGFDQMLFVCDQAVEPNPVKLETSRTIVILSHMLSVLCSNSSSCFVVPTYTFSLQIIRLYLKQTLLSAFNHLIW